MQIQVMNESKAMTLRLPDELAEQLALVAEIENRPISEVIRTAISEHIEECGKDLQFQANLRNKIARAQLLLRKQ